MSLFSPLLLPNGQVIPNRLAKAAMEENMADDEHAPGEDLIRLYRAWGEGGAGLIITGNVMIDARAMTGPAGVVLETDRFLERFRAWAQAGRRGGGQVWIQLNHPGRQMPVDLRQPTLAPSAVALDLGAQSKLFPTPRAMTAEDLQQVEHRFVVSALLAERAGFTGVEIHAAHGYLLSQFLSPLTNRRTDQWGGSLENRARLLFDIVRAVRAATRKDFAVAVKLNATDFQRGGFSAEEAREVVDGLGRLKTDLVELSGGNYEAPVMMGDMSDERGLAREAYFLELAQVISATAPMPIMVTGGIRRHDVAVRVLENAVAMVGMATAMAILPDLPRQWQNGQRPAPRLRPVGWKNKALAASARMAVVRYQLVRLGRARPVRPGISPLWALTLAWLAGKWQARRYRQWLSGQKPV